MSRRAGYTLIEMMIVVTIVGLSAVAFAPGIGRAVRDRRVSTVARELIRIGRRARSDTMGNLRAHVLWIDAVNRSIQLIRGTTNSCTIATAAWATLQGTCSDRTLVDAPCVENVSVANDFNDSNIFMYQETLNNSAPSYAKTPVALCYAPNGVVYSSAGNQFSDVISAGFSDANTVNGGYVFAIFRADTDGAPAATTRIHRVLFPLGGSARSLR